MSISVLMSVYLSEKADYLDIAIASVCEQQTLLPDQFVLVEDGPLGDELLSVIEDWKTKLGERMVIVRNMENVGLTKSLNRGLMHCTSDLIARMDSDDISEPLRFEREVEFLRRHPDITIVGGDIQEFSSTKGQLSVRKHPRTDEEVRNSIYKANPLAHSTVMMRRKMFDDGLKYDERYRKNQDLDLWFRALKAGYKIANIEDVLLQFRRDDKMFRRRSRKSAFLEFQIYTKGIYNLYGLFSTYYIYPLSRLCFRLMPNFLMKRIYDSKVRQMVAKSKTS